MTVLYPTIIINMSLSGRYCRNDTPPGLKSSKNCLYRSDARCSLFRKELKIGTTGEWVRLTECKKSEVKS